MKSWKIVGAVILIWVAVPAPVYSQADEWIPLFNGKDLSGWTPKITGCDLGDNFGDTFRVREGLLRVTYDAYDTFDSRDEPGASG